MEDYGCRVSFPKSGANMGVYEVIIDSGRLERETTKEADGFNFGVRHLHQKKRDGAEGSMSEEKNERRCCMW